MSSSVCTCSSTDPFSKRSARSGVTLHETDTGMTIILIESYAPKQWRVMVGSGAGWRVGKFNSDNLSGYHEAVGGSMEQLAEPIVADFDAVIPDRSKASVIHAQAYTEYMKSKVAATGGNCEEGVKETTG